jgi:hypothetical protein
MDTCEICLDSFDSLLTLHYFKEGANYDWDYMLVLVGSVGAFMVMFFNPTPSRPALLYFLRKFWGLIVIIRLLPEGRYFGVDELTSSAFDLGGLLALGASSLILILVVFQTILFLGPKLL